MSAGGSGTVCAHRRGPWLSQRKGAKEGAGGAGRERHRVAGWLAGGRASSVPRLVMCEAPSGQLEGQWEMASARR